MSAKSKQGKVVLVVLCTLGSIGWLAALFTPGFSFEAERDQGTTDVSAHTPYVEDLAARLRADPVHVDPLLAGSVGEKVITDEVRSAIRGSKHPIYLVAMPVFRGDGIDGDPQVFLAKLANAVDRRGTYLLVDQTTRGSAHYRGEGDATIYLPSIFDEQTATSMLKVVDEVAERAPEADPEENWFDNPVAQGLIMGAMFSVPLWYLLRLIRWSARRDRSYLKGFRE